MGGQSGEPRVKVGIEVHQQLLSPAKLFCGCPCLKSDFLPYAFERRLRPAQSEMGKVDPAAVFEFSKGKSNRYRWSPESSCLVEADEEPPHQMDPESLDSALLLAEMLGSKVLDEVHVMRKIVIDGSNTSGFQRTAVVGLGGELTVEGKRVGVQTVTIEEDAARILGEDGSAREFALDRLGVPLVEIALAPMAGDPEWAGKVALHLGRVLRSTGRVARGLGTIRQDLNVSVEGGRVVEVKGVQKLNLIAKVVDYETRRQTALIRVSEELRNRGVAAPKCRTKDVTGFLAGTSSRPLARELARGGKAVCISAEGLGGLLGLEPSKGVRLGREVAEVARASGLGGLVHSDEFSAQGVSSQEASGLRKQLGAGDMDALLILAGPPGTVDNAAEQVASRLTLAGAGVPAETRAATGDGETKYMRPRPGAERMYPETDVPAILVGDGRLKAVEKLVPVSWERKVAEYQSKYSLSREAALRVYDSDGSEAFEALSDELDLPPSFIASVLTELPVRLSREGVPPSALTVEVLSDLLRFTDKGKVAKEAAPDVLRALGKSGGSDVLGAIQSTGIRSTDRKEVEGVVDAAIERMWQLVDTKGEDAFSIVMGEVMKELRGRADGALVSEVLSRRLKARRANPE